MSPNDSNDARLEFWFEFGSSYSYPAAARIEDVASEGNVTLAWRPFLLGPIFRDQGWEDSPFNLYPAKGRYMWRDLTRICGQMGLPFRRPSKFPRNGLLAARVACQFDSETWLPPFVRAVYHANFAEDRDISTPATIASLLQKLGLPAEDVLRQAASPECKAKLRAQTEHARDAGIFGAPAFLAAGELFWGNDRLEDSVEWLLKSRSGARDRP